MSVEELSVLHRRYVDLSQRFRAAWVFHQFLQSLAKLFLQSFENRYPADFQTLYTELKEVSQSLNTTEVDRLAGRFAEIERQLREVTSALLVEDSRVDPAFLRQFYHRFRSYDDKILIQLVRFYAYSHEGGAWHPDRLDKVDFLITRLGEEEQEGAGQVVVRDRKHLGEVFRSLTPLVPGAGAAPEEAEAKRRSIDELREEIAGVDSLDALDNRQLVPLYRTIKHSLGDLFWASGVLMAVLETNLAFKNAVRRLYRREERRIYSEYQQIFELEREVSVGDELDRELGRFREDIERFEQQIQSEDVRLDELARIRERARGLMPRLTSQRAAPPPPAPAPPPTAAKSPEQTPPPAPIRHEGEEQVVGHHLERLIDALDGISLGAPPRTVILTPDLFSFRLEPREVVAHRRLSGAGEAGTVEGLGAEVERFLLRAAALRVRMVEEAEEIQRLRDSTGGGLEDELYAQARATAQAGDAYLGRFAHFIHRAVVDGQPEEARQLEVLRMRLMRDFSNLWLLAYKRQIHESGPK